MDNKFGRGFARISDRKVQTYGEWADCVSVDHGPAFYTDGHAIGPLQPYPKKSPPVYDSAAWTGRYLPEGFNFYAPYKRVGDTFYIELKAIPFWFRVKKRIIWALSRLLWPT